MPEKSCPRCGYLMTPFDTSCPRCARQPASRPPSLTPPAAAPSLAAGQDPRIARATLAGFWIRFAAALIDGLILTAIGAVIKVASGSSLPVEDNPLLLLVVCPAYSILLIGGAGWTIGMRALNLLVVRTDGAKIGYGVAALRWLGSLLSTLACSIGYLWIAFDPDKQAWHDKIANTNVLQL